MSRHGFIIIIGVGRMVDSGAIICFVGECVRVCHLVDMVVCIVDLVSLPVKQVWLGKDDETAVTVGFGA